MRRLEMLQPILPQVNVVLLEMLVQAETKEMKKKIHSEGSYYYR